MPYNTISILFTTIHGSSRYVSMRSTGQSTSVDIPCTPCELELPVYPLSIFKTTCRTKVRTDQAMTGLYAPTISWQVGHVYRGLAGNWILTAYSIRSRWCAWMELRVVWDPQACSCSTSRWAIDMNKSGHCSTRSTMKMPCTHGNTGVNGCTCTLKTWYIYLTCRTTEPWHEYYNRRGNVSAGY